ncbi:MAG TPA: family 10 glycosylhydrolase [bacterium]|nr:family 10 glycosylhydrolase [bacterium]
MNRFASVALALCLLAIGISSVAFANEFRGLWVDTWHNGIFDAGQVTTMINNADAYNFNAVLPEVRLRGDAFYFPTYPNIEPRNTRIGSTFDPLQDTITKAHAKGIEVHAWITTFPCLSTTANSHPNHVSNKHPEWLMQNYSGSTDFGEGKYLDPGVPDALIWIYNVCMDLVTNYDIDGLHLDYIRYPGTDSGYNPIAIARFNKEFSRTGKPGTSDATFATWRRRQVTDFVKFIYLNAIAVKPNMKLTVSTFASRSDAYNARFQDWAAWMSQGIIDANVPMNYTTGSTFRSRVNDAVANKYSRHLYMGVGADDSDLVNDMLYARNAGCEGLCLYSYYVGTTYNVFPAIKSSVFPTKVSQPVMTWKTSPTRGYIKGTVTSQGNIVYNANVSVVGQALTSKSDGNGFYGFLNMIPGSYTVRCEAESCEPETAYVTVSAGAVKTVDFNLRLGNTPTPTYTPTPWPTNVPYTNVVDDIDLGFTSVGSWTHKTDSAGASYGPSYKVTYTGTQGDRAEWRPNLLYSGRYRVSIWYTSGSNRPSSVPYTVYHQSGNQTFYVNQQVNGSRWNYLGEFSFSSGSSGYVSLLEQVPDGAAVIADAVLFEYVPPPSPTPTATATPRPWPTPAGGNYFQVLGK